MYIKYHRNQKSLDFEDKTNYRLGLAGGDYRPTWLVRVSDWKKVPGQEAVDGYHTLSYCWGQSGEIVKRNDNSEEYDCIDNGYHCIVEYVKKRKPRNFFRHTIKKYVKYDELLQQVCKDFQVEYVWYDKLCIDQLDNEIKLKQIKEMHKVYRNARCTVAMVPELHSLIPKHFENKDYQHGTWSRLFAVLDLYDSHWMKRSWTLEEVMMSKRILFVGTDINMIQHSLHTTDFPTVVDLFSDTLLDFGGENREKGSINQALSQAHFRTSTKPHDMIFALVNTFAHMFDDIDLNYDTDIGTTFNTFYRTIATRDLSILCFGSNQLTNGAIESKSTMGNYSLPSWTGVDGHHAYDRVDSTIHPSLKYNIEIDDMCMYITTSCYWDISIVPYDGGCFSSSIANKYVTNTFSNHAHRINVARLKGREINMKTAGKNTVLQEWDVNISNVCCFMTHYHKPSPGSHSQIRPLSLTEDCKACIVLPILLKLYKSVYSTTVECSFGGYEHSYFLPVFRKSFDGTGRYKAVGIYYVGDDANSESHTFNWNHCVDRDDVCPEKQPEEILNILFESNHHGSVPEEFVIE